VNGPAATARVAPVIVNWNGWEDTLDCVRSLLGATWPAIDIVIVENGSSNDSWSRLVDFCVHEGLDHRTVTCNEKGMLAQSPEPPPESLINGKRVHLLHSPVNLGLCRGTNLGMDYAIRCGCDYLVMLNNDTVCTPGFLEPLVQTASGAERAGLVGGLIARWEQQDSVWWAGGVFDSFLETQRIGDGRPVADYLDGPVRETEWISGCMTLMASAVFQRLGGLDESFFIWSEEWDQSLRARAAGYRLYINPASLIYHKVGRSLGVMKPLSYYYGTRNRLLLKKKHLPLWRRALFMAWFLPARAVRYAQFLLTGRSDLVHAGVSALFDYFAGRTGIWEHQRRTAGQA
jgi:GT2 family glycosyltransferase